MATVIQQPRSSGDSIRAGVGQGLSNLIQTGSQAYFNRSDEAALQKSIEGLGANPSPRDVLNAVTGTHTYSPESKQTALKNYLGVEQFEETKRKAMETEKIAAEKNRIAADKKQTKADAADLKASLIADGVPDYEADLYVKSPPGVQGRIIQNHNEAKSRGLRQPQQQQAQQPVVNEPEAQAGTPQQPLAQPSIEEEVQETREEAAKPDSVQEANEEARELPKAAEQIAETETWPELPAPKETTPAEREKWRAANQKENNKLLKETKDKTNAHVNSLIRYNRLTNLNESKKLPAGIGRLVINPETGEPYPVASLLGVVNKETQDFVKTLNDFLIDAKAYFGGRVTNFDVSSFKARLPSLLNTEGGRRLIIEQMRLMEGLEIVRDKELESALKHYGRNASYSDIQSQVDGRVEQKEQATIAKMNNLDQAANYLDLMSKDPTFQDSVLMQSKDGRFKAVKKSQVNAATAKGYERW